METWPDSSYTPFRGAKGSTWEGGIRVPGIFYWKGMIEPGRVSDGLFDFCDIFPTFCALAGVEELPQDRYIDGVDQRGFLLTGSAPAGTYWAMDPAWESNRLSVYAYLLDHYSAIRLGPWKFFTVGIEMGAIPDTVTPGGFSGYLLNIHTARSSTYSSTPKKSTASWSERSCTRPWPRLSG